MRFGGSKFLAITAAAFAAACLCGCLPEDEIQSLQFSPSGKLLAVASEKNGLRIINPDTLETTTVATGEVHPGSLAWNKSESALAYAAAPETSYDIYISSLDGQTTRVTESPSSEFFPMICQHTLLHLTTENGISQFTTHALTAATSAPLVLPQTDTDIFQPALSPDGRHLAFFTCEDLRPQLHLTRLADGHTSVIVRHADPFRLVTTDLSWTPDSTALIWLEGVHLSSPTTDDAALGDAGNDTTARSIWMKALNEAPVRRVVSADNDLCWPRAADEASLVFVQGKTLTLDSISTAAEAPETRRLSTDLPIRLPALGGADHQIAFVAAGQLIGMADARLSCSRILTFSPEEQFLLAEEYYRAGNSSKSLELYEELAASVKRTRDPEAARFIYIANLRRLGETHKAVEELEKLARDEHTTHTVPASILWRLLGYSYLLELDDLPRATASFARYAELTSDTLAAEDNYPALNALEILKTTPPAVARLYGRAVKARLDANLPLTNTLFGDLLTSGASCEAIAREYMNALDGFDAEVYQFSPSQRPFLISKSQHTEYLQRLVDTVTTPSEPLRRAKLDLFLLRIQTGHFRRARTLLRDALQSAPPESRPEGILEVFRNYLETPEPQPWINAAMPEVFLHSEIRPLLLSFTTDPADRLLVFVAATKMALMQGRSDQARAEANLAGAEWARLSEEDQAGSEAALYGRVLVLRAREAEQRGLFAEAADAYTQALQLLEEKKVDNVELQEEIRFRGDLLRSWLPDYPAMPPQWRAIEDVTGAELINPTWDVNALKTGVEMLVDLYDSTTSTLKHWAAYEAGICYGKLRQFPLSRAALLLATNDSAPSFLQRKALFELAAVDEYLQDNWNAARWYARMAALPSTNENTRLWCSYQIARLHLSINYKTSAAREALALIISARPDSPLAIQAQELLISTEIR